MQDKNDQGTNETSAPTVSGSRRNIGRVVSANPNSRSHRMASVSSHEANMASGGLVASQNSSVFNTTVGGGGVTTRNQAAQISAEVHMRQNQHSNKSLVNVSSSGQINHDTKSLTQVQSDPKLFSSATNTRRKLPIGFLV